MIVTVHLVCNVERWRQSALQSEFKKLKCEFSQFKGDCSINSVFFNLHFHIKGSRPKHEIPMCVLGHKFWIIFVLHVHFWYTLVYLWIIFVIGEDPVCNIRVNSHTHVALDLKKTILRALVNEQPSVISSQTDITCLHQTRDYYLSSLALSNYWSQKVWYYLVKNQQG